MLDDPGWSTDTKQVSKYTDFSTSPNLPLVKFKHKNFWYENTPIAKIFRTNFTVIFFTDVRHFEPQISKLRKIGIIVEIQTMVKLLKDKFRNFPKLTTYIIAHANALK